MLRIEVVTLFPEMVKTVVEYGIVRRAVERQLLHVNMRNPRDYTHDARRRVDDRPYGGGAGMVMMAAPLCAAIDDARRACRTGASGGAVSVIHLSPQGRRLDQRGVLELAERGPLVLVAGRYEGVDERVIESAVDEEWSIGDYVLSGGELAAMVLIDALIRVVPEVLGHEESAREDSFFDGLLDYPHYTRPECFDGMHVPEALLSGNHEVIRQWRQQQVLGRTWLKRPDLLEGLVLDKEQQELLAAFQHAVERDSPQR